MKKSVRTKLVTVALLAVAVIATVELQKFMKSRDEACVGGVCKLPSEIAGAVVGPQSVPLLAAPSRTDRQPLPELIDFGAGNCATCKMMNIVLDELSRDYANQLSIRFFDAREHEETAKKYSIRMIPTQVFLDAAGNELFRHEGFISKEDIVAKWQELGIQLTPSNE